ncbi:MAG TPA: hypothetical protein VMW48_04350 [Vicinamibacterales bacterium]|nr:hypothetical protein [Vicinamibacterales bacterium]
MVRIEGITTADRAVAREMFVVMSAMFETNGQPLGVTRAACPRRACSSPWALPGPPAPER